MHAAPATHHTPPLPRRFPRPRWMLLAALPLAALVIGGCATVPPPLEQMAVSKAAIEHALGAGGSDFAADAMGNARVKQARADRAMSERDYPVALAMAQQAQVDAQLAEATAHAARARQAAAESQAAERALREELQRKAAP